MSHKREQLVSSLHRAVAELLVEGLADPRIRGLVSVTGVEVSPDNHYADVGISVLPASGENLAIQGLNAAAGHLRMEVSRKLLIRTVPELRFRADPSIKREAQVLDAIRKAVGQAPADNPGEEVRK